MNRFLERLKGPHQLSMVLIGYIFIAAAAALICNTVVSSGLNAAAGLLTDRKNYYQKHMDATVEDFRSYVEANEIRIGDSEKIGQWNSDNWYVFLMVYKEDEIYYNSMYSDLQLVQNELKEEIPGTKYTFFYRHDNSLRYKVSFADGQGEILIRAYFEARFQTLLLLFSMGFSACCFILVFLILFQKKLRYISQIEKGIKILESGGLEYRIPEKGHDELHSLAQSINQMRDTLQEEIQSKDEIQRENNEMVTSLSHDIRTPLTSVLFYLDLIADKKYGEDQLEVYTQKAKEQAYHMKELMDDLFGYAYIMGKEQVLRLERYDGVELIGQLMEDLAERLREKGYQVKTDFEVKMQFSIMADAYQLKRVFDNLGSNIEKYAILEEPAVFSVSLKQSALEVVQQNAIRECMSGCPSGYGIGMKTSRKIVEKHGGSMKFSSENYHFKIKITFPVLY